MRVGNRVNKAHVGFEEYYLAELVEDTLEAVSYIEPYHFTNPITLSASPESEVVVGKAGDKDIETGQTKGGGTLTLDVWNIESDILQLITGAVKDEDGILSFSSSDVSPHFALICKKTRQKGKNGGAVEGYSTYVAFPKVIFSVPGDEASTKDGVEFTNVSLEAQVIDREFDGKYKFQISENDEGFDKDVFFNKVFLNETKGEEGEETP